MSRRRRISLELPEEMVLELEAQARELEVPRQDLIETALLGFLTELRSIDAEYAAKIPDTPRRSAPTDTYKGRRVRPARTESGSGVIELMLCLGLLVFPVCGLVAITAWPERMNAAHAAAYEAARTVAEAPDPSAALDLGRERALEVLADHGLPTDDVDVSYSSSSPGRGEPLQATVTITLPALVFPGLSHWDAVRWSRSNVQRVGDYGGFR